MLIYSGRATTAPGVLLVAVLLAYSLSWAMDKAFMRRLVRDRVAGIAYGCTLVFLLLMGGIFGRAKATDGPAQG